MNSKSIITEVSRSVHRFEQNLHQTEIQIKSWCLGRTFFSSDKNRSKLMKPVVN